MVGKVYGYLRCSCASQDIENYKNWILQKANNLKLGPVEWVQETISGKRDWRKRELGKLFEKLEKGDIIITFEYSRLGRNLVNSIGFLDSCDNKCIKVYPGDIDIDLNNTKSNVELCIQGMSSQMERENISRRTKATLERKKQLGMKLGKHKQIMKLDKDGKGKFRNEKNENDIYNLLIQGVKIKKIAEKYNMHPIIMGKYIKKWDLKKPKEERNQDIIKRSTELSEKATNDYIKNQTLKNKQQI